MAIGAFEARIPKVLRVFELLSVSVEFLQLSALSLCQNDVAGIAVIGLNRAFAVFRFMFAVVAPKTSGPGPVPKIIRVRGPISLH